MDKYYKIIGVYRLSEELQECLISNGPLPLPEYEKIETTSRNANGIYHHGLYILFAESYYRIEIEETDEYVSSPFSIEDFSRFSILYNIDSNGHLYIYNSSKNSVLLDEKLIIKG